MISPGSHRSPRDSILNSDAVIRTAVVWSVPLDTGHKTPQTCGQLVPQPLFSQPFAMSRVPVTNPAYNDPRANLANSPCTTDLYMVTRWDMTGVYHVSHIRF